MAVGPMQQEALRGRLVLGPTGEFPDPERRDRTAGRLVLQLAAARLGFGDRARDVVQDAFVKFMAQPAAAVDGHAVEWLFTVCRNRALDVLRKEHRVRRFEEGEMERASGADSELQAVGRSAAATRRLLLCGRHRG